MIAKKYRLREYEVTRVFKKGRPSFGAFWTMNFLEVRNAKNHRMAVTVTRKHDKRAVARNRYRRGLYDGMHALLTSAKCKVQSAQGMNIDSFTNKGNLPPGERGAGGIKFYQVIFTLKKGLKLTEKKIPDAWVNDAQRLFERLMSTSTQRRV